MRLVVCGSRHWQDQNFVSEVLTGFYSEVTVGHLVAEMSEFIVIEGGAPGADTCAAVWAESSPMHSYNEKQDDPLFKHITVVADWDQYGKRAGPIRNAEMLRLKPDIVFVFKDGFDFGLKSGGTEHMVGIAKKANVPVRLFCHV